VGNAQRSGHCSVILQLIRFPLLQSAGGIWLHHGSEVLRQLAHAGSHVSCAHADDHALWRPIDCAGFAWALAIAVNLHVCALLFPRFRHIGEAQRMYREVALDCRGGRCVDQNFSSKFKLQLSRKNVDLLADIKDAEKRLLRGSYALDRLPRRQLVEDVGSPHFQKKSCV